MEKGLYCNEMGDADGAPILLLHGFGGRAQNWSRLQSRLSASKATLAYDLPGHGRSLDFPGPGEPKVAAQAIIADLAARKLEKVHLVGFSMGGAVASIIGLIAPELVASMTLLAPGGFGPEINHRILQAYARAENEQSIKAIMPQFFGFSSPISDQFIEDEIRARREPGAVESLIRIADLLFDGSKQGVIPVQPLIDIGAPIKILWGTQDNILPTRQAHKLPGLVATHVFPDTGHMLIEEQEDNVFRLIVENTSSI